MVHSLSFEKSLIFVIVTYIYMYIIFTNSEYIDIIYVNIFAILYAFYCKRINFVQTIFKHNFIKIRYRYKRYFSPTRRTTIAGLTSSQIKTFFLTRFILNCFIHSNCIKYIMHRNFSYILISDRNPPLPLALF